MSQTQNERFIGAWLLICCAVLLVLVTVGGATRLTGSGLSIVDWRPVTGALPPLNDAQWMVEFEKYRQSPEYQKVNRGMSLDEFRTIFWWEWGHRALARLLGAVFAIPLLLFWVNGRLPTHLRWPLLGTLFLGGAQGYMGWYMVQSGLVDIPRVSPYRLAAHLSLALLIFAAMFWIALDCLRPADSSPRKQRAPAGRLFPLLLSFAALTILAGAFVAGLKAGYLYNTFPLMDGRWIPEGLVEMQPAWRNLFENPLTAQFVHRYLAMSTFALVALAWILGLRACPPGPTRRSLHLLMATVTLQLLTGISTLLLHVPVWLGTMHQGGAVIVLAALLAVGHFGWRQTSRSSWQPVGRGPS